MVNLIKNEWIKIFKRVGTFVMVGILALLVIGMGGLYKYSETQSEPTQQADWKQETESIIAENKKNLEETGQQNSNLNSFYQREIAINEYRLKENIPPETETHLWTFVKESVSIFGFAGVFIIIIASGIVSSEFSTGTIKLLLIRPIRRSKILLSKYLTVLLFGLFLLVFIFVISAIVGLVLFGMPTNDVSHLAYTNGKVIEQSIVTHLIGEYFISSIDIIMLTTLAFMISTIFRNSSLAIGITLFLLFTGNTIVTLLASRFDWTKYLLFANTYLGVYFDGVPPVEGMTIGFSITMLVIYFVLFHALAFTVFKRRDVAA
ncbi:ABC transporter permease [Metabacillus malikii]|uniref:ABC-2 type transport system permease protein n=1 Tax=Metabacillus malikii TaxID=1504265 RepID=A0ABT9ZHF6_9BACI|nr:ABC transporter permease [Metabacillus malikii]MDQ0231713.1 ABC-2 type transport system permease protein [Metabacillus malikii]